ncbi:MAG: PAS domain S-box protein [Blastocatellia bacterium]|nr:PAS domain S-box protein [Blastocatellia bacterium]MBN8724052.1 PAS domain S-box protein [Acidobacteriota bacterium]
MLKDKVFNFLFSAEQQQNALLAKALENISLGITITNVEGKIIYTNSADALMHGYTVEELVGQEIKCFSPKELWKPITVDELRKLTSWQRETVNIKKDGSVFPVQLNSTVLLDDHNQPVAIVTTCENISNRKSVEEMEFLFQISQARTQAEEIISQELQQESAGRKKAEAELKETYQTLQALILASPLAIIMLNPDDTVKIWNPAAQRVFGWKEHEVIGKPLPFSSVDEEELILAEELSDRDKELLLWDKAFASARTKQLRLDNSMETRRQKRDGSIIDVSISVAPLFDKNGYLSGSMAIIADISEHKLAEQKLRESQQQLRALSLRLQSLQEEERTKIAREIHDELGQALTALKMDLAWINKKLVIEQEVIKNKFQSMFQLIDSTIQTVRRLSTKLRPTILDDLGLVPAIEWAIKEFQSRTEMECNLVIEPKDFNVEIHLATTIFRVLQEALTNVARHANATKLDVILRKTTNAIFLEIKDNGQGITETEVSNPKSLGLIGIRERVLAWQGKVSIVGNFRQGTTLSVEIPILTN